MMTFNVRCPHCEQPVYGSRPDVTLMITVVPVVLESAKECQHCHNSVVFEPHPELPDVWFRYVKKSD